jgi:hypothetical protein
MIYTLKYYFLSMKKLLLFIALLLGIECAWAQFELKKYTSKNTNGTIETLWIDYEPNDKGEMGKKIYYQSNSQKTRLELQNLEETKDGETKVKFPNDSQIYILKDGTAMGELICLNPNGKTQVFSELVDEDSYLIYVSNNQGVKETLYVKYSLGMGAWYIVDYSSSKQKSKIRLQIVETGEQCQVKFPNDPQIYTLRLQYDENNTNNHAKHLIICTDAKGKAQTFRYKNK